jgi:hypothetical protein
LKKIDAAGAKVAAQVSRRKCPRRKSRRTFIFTLNFTILLGIQIGFGITKNARIQGNWLPLNNVKFLFAQT